MVGIDCGAVVVCEGLGVEEVLDMEVVDDEGGGEGGGELFMLSGSGDGCLLCSRQSLL